MAPLQITATDATEHSTGGAAATRDMRILHFQPSIFIRSDFMDSRERAFYHLVSLFTASPPLLLPLPISNTSRPSSTSSSRIIPARVLTFPQMYYRLAKS